MSNLLQKKKKWTRRLYSLRNKHYDIFSPVKFMKKFFPLIIPLVSGVFVAVFAHGITPYTYTAQTASVGTVVEHAPQMLVEKSVVSNDTPVLFPIETEVPVETESVVEVASETLFSEFEIGTVVDVAQERESLTKYITCPFSEEDNRIIVDFTENGAVPVSELEIRADRDSADATYTKDALEIGPGSYVLHVASYRMPDDLELLDMYEEHWFVTLFSKDGTELFTSSPTRDLQKDEIKTIELVDRDASFVDTVEKAVVHHGAYSNTKSQKITPLCMAFDILQPEDMSYQEESQEELRDGGGILATKTTVVIPSDTQKVVEGEYDETASQVLSERLVQLDEKTTTPLPRKKELFLDSVYDRAETLTTNSTTQEQAPQVSAVGTTVSESQKGLTLMYMLSLLGALGMILVLSVPHTENAKERSIL
jgi:hypothetical protein